MLACAAPLVCFAPSAFGQSSGQNKTQVPKTVVILASGLSWADVEKNRDLRSVLQNMVRGDLAGGGGGIALLNPAVSGEATDASAFLSVGAGERMAAPGTNGPLLWENETPRRISDFAEEVVTRRGGNEEAEAGYRQRMGVLLPKNAAVFHLGIGPLRNAQPDTRRAALVGALGTALQTGGRSVAVWGDFRSTLAGMNAQGTVPFGTTTPAVFDDKTTAAVLQTAQTADVTIISAPDARAFADLVRVFLPLANAGKANLLAASVAPPRDKAKWESLGFVAASGPFYRVEKSRIAPGLLISPTTRTPGLVANVDLASTICEMQKINPALLGGGAGRMMRLRRTQTDPFTVLSRLDKQVRGATNAAVPVLVGWGTLAFLGAFLAVWGAAIQSKPLVRTANAALLVSSAVFLALLPVGVFSPVPVALYAGSVLLLSGIIALFVFWLGKVLHKSPLGLVFAATVLIIAFDTLNGAPDGASMISRSALSGYFLSGVRFYGVGNEYMGVLIGAFLCAFGLLLPGLVPAWGRVRAAFALAAAFLTLIIGLPILGANAGGAVSCAVAFGTAFWALSGRLRVWHVLLSFVLAVAFVACLALTDAARTGGAQSHIGAAATISAQSGGLQKLTALAYGKIAMNARLTASPFALAALVLFVPLFGWLRAGRVGETVRESLAARPVLRRLLPAVFWGAGAAFVFNDSGIVAALLISACITASVLEGVCDDILGRSQG